MYVKTRTCTGEIMLLHEKRHMTPHVQSVTAMFTGKNVNVHVETRIHAVKIVPVRIEHARMKTKLAKVHT